MGFWSTIKKEAKKEYSKRKELRSIESKALHEARKKEAVKYAKRKAAQETKIRLQPRQRGDILGKIAGDIPMNAAPKYKTVTKRVKVKPKRKRPKYKTVRKRVRVQETRGPSINEQLSRMI